jgi:hypothetical protein
MSFFVNPDGSEYIPQVESKQCTKCNKILHINNFPWGSGAQTYRRTECRPCCIKLKKESKHLRKVFGNAPDDYRCPICNRTKEEVRGEGNKNSPDFVIDHDHATGKFRGWLCHSCNRTIGGVEKIQNINNIIEYLKPQAV